MSDDPEDYDDEIGEGWDDDFDDDADFDMCGMGPDGQCQLAGSEWCDWDCPRERQARTDATIKARQDGQADLPGILRDALAEHPTNTNSDDTLTNL